MADVRKLRSRGANIVVAAYGEALFAPGTDLSRWKTRFSQRIRSKTEGFAPTNSRPRWGHYGKPLKATISANTKTRITKGGGFFYITVGSGSRHAYYVDQGTGVFNGSSPWLAKILPPYTWGGASLYEATWKPGGPLGTPVSPVYIKGQRAQHFFDKGLGAAFVSMRMRSQQIPGEGVGSIRSAMATLPVGMIDFKGNTTDASTGGGLRLSLTEWRAWRDEAWSRGEGLGRGGGLATRAHAEFRNKGKDVQNLKNFLSTKRADETRRTKQITALNEEQQAKALAKERKAEEERSKAHNASMQGYRFQAHALAQRYANAGYTKVGTVKMVDSAGNLRGYAVVFISPSGEPGRIEFP